MILDSRTQLTQIFPGDSEMARRMRTLDWSTTPLGPPARWPENLRLALSICLTSRFPMHVWWGADLTLLYNDGYIPLLGPSKHPAVLGRSGRLAWKEIWDIIGPMIDRVFAAGTASWSEDILMFFDRLLPQEEVYLTFSFSPVFGTGGNVDGMFCACSEVTDKIIGARRLETLRKLGRAAEAHTDCKACEAAAKALSENPFDVPFTAIYLADEAKANLVLTAGARLQENWPDLPASLPANDTRHCLPSRLAQVLSSKAALEIDLPSAAAYTWPTVARRALLLPIRTAAHDTSDGVVVLGINTRRPLDAAYRSFFDLVASHIGRALADARIYEAERRRAEALAEIDRAKNTFFSNVSHELRTPITLMLGPLEDVLNTDPSVLPPEQFNNLQIAYRNGRRLLKLVNTLLDFARLQAGRVSADYEPTNLCALTVDLASNFRAACERAGIAFNVDCEPLDVSTHVDRAMWEGIVLNLLSNAFKFTLRGEITVRLRQENDTAHLTVTDTGCGIPESDLSLIFQRFHRIDSMAGRTQEGVGIGLSLVRELVHLHGGKVWATSEMSRGSTFHVVIPLQQQSSLQTLETPAKASSSGVRPFIEEALRWLPNGGDTSSAKPAGSEQEAEQEEIPGFRVLIADDNADMRDYLRSLLSSCAHVDVARDGEEALQALTDARYDLLLVDVMMPGMDGFTLLRHIRTNPELHFLSVVVLSARAGEEARAEGLLAGADDYLVKPFSAHQLVSRIGSCLALTRMRAEQLAASEASLRESQGKLGVMVGELQHRTRNLLGVIRAIANSTLQKSLSLGEFKDKFLARLDALARVQSLLSRLGEGERISFDQLLQAELAAHPCADGDTSAIVLEGPHDVPLRSASVHTLALALHELATNAVKYGALSQPGGRLSVEWHLLASDDGEPKLHVDWRESGVTMPTHEGGAGQGRTLIEKALPYQLGALTEYELGPDGVHCAITLPVSSTIN